MKKLLALVLALVMTLSLCVVSSNAAYTDKADIDLKEAVDVLTAVGVFQGSDGKFDPKANLTREQAAKLVSYLQVGQKAADALVGGGKFADVAKDRWSAGYVDYCASIGIAAGVGDGKFDPTGSLTALQFGKMLLVCLGYDAKSEGMVGADWQINTSKLMASAKLLDGLDDVTANSVVTREQAAQMMLNALEAPMVEYANRATSISVNGANIVFGGSTASYVTSTIASEQNISGITLTSSGGAAFTVELGEKLFPKLKLTDPTDAFERPANYWRYKGAEIGTYANTADLTYTEKVTADKIYDELGLTATVNAAVYEDGNAVADFEIKNGATDTDHKIGGQGTLVEVFKTTAIDGTVTVKIVKINTYFGEITSTVAATATKKAYVVVAAKGDVNTTFGGSFTTDKTFAIGDLVLYTVSSKGGTKAIKSVDKAESASATVTGFTTGTSVTTDNGTYKYAAKFTKEAANASVNKSVTLYFDKYNNVIYVDGASATNYAVVLKKSTSAFVDQAKLLFTDGTVEVVNLTAEYGDNENDIVTYTVNGNNEYTLTQAAVPAAAAATITNSNYQFTANSITYTANGKTTFLVKTADAAGNTVYNAYDGIKAVPTISKVTTTGHNVAVYCKSGTLATVVYVDAIGNGNNIYNSNSDVVFVKGNTTTTKTTTYGVGDYWEYDAIINGEVTKVKSGAQITAYGLYTGANVDANGVWTLTGAATRRLGVLKQANDVVGYGLYDSVGTFYAVASDAKVWFVDEEGTLSVGYTAASIIADKNDFVWFKLDTAGTAAKTIVIQKNDDLAFATELKGTINTSAALGTAAKFAPYLIDTADPDDVLTTTAQYNVTDTLVFKKNASTDTVVLVDANGTVVDDNDGTGLANTLTTYDYEGFTAGDTYSYAIYSAAGVLLAYGQFTVPAV